MTFSLKVMGIITYILFGIDKNNFKKDKSFENEKELHRRIFLHTCKYRHSWFCMINNKWQLKCIDNYFEEIVRACLFGTKFVKELIQILYTKWFAIKQLHFPLICFKNDSIDDKNLYFYNPFTSSPSPKKRNDKSRKIPAHKSRKIPAEMIKFLPDVGRGGGWKWLHVDHYAHMPFLIKT